MIKNGIIGYPLKNPRSITIWREYFKKKRMSASMNKFEVKPSNLNKFIKDLRKNKKFKAAAVTMPYKKKIYKLIDNYDNFAKTSKSINLIVKQKDKLFGYNTDVYGANETIKKILAKYKLIIIIGLGGTGSAIFNYLYSKYKRKKYLLISKKFVFKNSGKIKIKKKLTKNVLKDKSLIINCSPLGSNLKKKFISKSPINKSLINSINKRSTVFDIIYSPEKTLLSKMLKKIKINYINGKYMNTVQAIRSLELAFGKK